MALKRGLYSKLHGFAIAECPVSFQLNVVKSSFKFDMSVGIGFEQLLGLVHEPACVPAVLCPWTSI